MTSPSVAAADARPISIPRSIGFWTALALVVGNMVGSGIFLLPASLAPYGAASLLGWGLSVSGALLLAVVFARLSRFHPQTGGPYAYARIAFGDFVGFIIAWGYWVSIWTGNAAIAVTVAGSVGALFPAATSTPLRAASIALLTIWSCTFFNLRGVRTAGWVQNATTVMKLLPLVLVPLAGMWWFQPELLTPFNRSGGNLPDVAAVTALLALWSFLGLESATIPAEHVKDAERTMSRATLIGTAIAAAVTVLGCTVVMGLVPAAELQTSGAPFAEAARKLWGAPAGLVIAAAATIAGYGCINGWILLQGQIPLAAARDGLFPARFARTDAAGTPAFGLLLGSVLSTILVAANFNGSLVKIFTFAILLSTAVTLVPYLVCAAACIKLEWRRKTAPAPSYAVTIAAALALVYSVWALAEGTKPEEQYWGAALMLAGLPMYWWQRRTRRSS